MPKKRMPPKFLFIKEKRKEKSPSPKNRKWHASIAARGAIFYPVEKEINGLREAKPIDYSFHGHHAQYEIMASKARKALNIRENDKVDFVNVGGKFFAKTTARVLSNTPTNPNAKYFEIIGEPIIHDLKAIEQEIKRARKGRKQK